MRAQEVVGRDTELALLASRLVLDSLPHVFLIAGEAGIGKSALIRGFTERARAGGMRVLIGECTPIEIGRPFGPLAEVFLQAQCDSAISALVERSLADADLHLPALTGANPATANVATDPSERYRAHAAILDVLRRVARTRPLAIVLEDVHWADEATLDLLTYAVRRLGSEPLLLLVTYRSDELHRLHRLVPVLAELRRARLVEEVRLPPLSRAATAALIQMGLGLAHPPDARLRDEVFERCEGNPYFTEEVLRAIPREVIERGAPALVARGSSALPASMRETLWARLATLGESTRRVAQLAAVVGHRFEFDVLKRVSGEADDTLLAALYALIEAHIIDETTDGAGRPCFAFHHALTHEAVLAELLERERATLHRVVGLALEAKYAHDPSAVAEDLAFQFDGAGDRLRASRYHLLAAETAEVALAFRSATRHLERAIATAPDDDELLSGLELRLARDAVLAGTPAIAVQACRSALARPRRPNDERRRGWLGAMLSEAQWHQGSREGADAAIAEAIATLEPLGPSAELAVTYSIAGARAQIAGDAARGLAFGEKAIALARQFDAPEALARGLLSVGETRAQGGDRSALALIREAIVVGESHHLADITLAAYGNLVMSVRALGDPPAEVREVHEESARYARNVTHYRDRFLSHDIDFLIGDGEWDKAISHAADIGDTIWRETALLQIAVIRTLREGPAALGSSSPYRERLLAAMDPQWVSRATSLSAVAFLVHDSRAALAYASDLKTSRNSSALTWSALTRIGAIAAACELGDASAKREWIDQTLAQKRPVEARITAAARAFARAADTDDDRVALAELDAAVALIEDDVLRLAEVIIRLHRADIRSRGTSRADHAAARDDLAAVRNFAERAGATWFLADLRRWADEHGLRPADIASSDAKPALTRREREIARLVASGLTDREIADRLVIGQRTAEGHVAHILSKLGFRARSEIAAWSTRDQLAAAVTTDENRVPKNT
jgi:DNA-binding CsgD family transcriptional regulator